jgi:hypothetical protein
MVNIITVQDLCATDRVVAAGFMLLGIILISSINSPNEVVLIRTRSPN